MRILVFSEYYYPERFLINEIAEELAKKGNSVTVVTGKPNYNFPNGKVPKEYRHINYEVINGVKIYRCNVLGRGSNKIRLLLNYFSYAKNAKRTAKKIKNEFDVVYCYQLTPVTQLYPAVFYAKKFHLPLVCYCLDLAPLSGEKTLGNCKFAKKIYYNISRKLYHSCDEILVTSKSFVKYFDEVHSIPSEKIKYFPQHASDVLLSHDLTKINSKSKNVFMFAGNIGNGPNLHNIVLAVEILKNEDVKNFCVKFVGNGSAKDSLKSLVIKKNLCDYIEFMDAVSMEKMPEIYKTADVLLVTLRKGQITIPGKLQAYMATGKPIIGSMDYSGFDLIKDSQCGVCVPADDYKALAEKMKDYIEKPETFANFGKQGKKYFIENFKLNAFINKLENVLNYYVLKNKGKIQ